MPRPSLMPQIAARIIAHVRDAGLPRGAHLASQSLADAFRVSRAPVAAALRHLDALGVVRSEANRGYFLLKSGADLDGLTLTPPPRAEDEDALYFQIAEDRLAGKLPLRVTEAELMRLYDLPRTRVLKILHRSAEEGWIERLPGNGWAFRPALASREAYEQAYQFRAAIESQALLLPSFTIDAALFRKARAEQQEILDGGFSRLSRDRLFRVNCDFHEMLVGSAHNDFFLDALRRVNRLRRLMEYRISVDRSRLPAQSEEHLKILALLEAGERQYAADFLRVHILGACAIKTPQIA